MGNSIDVESKVQIYEFDGKKDNTLKSDEELLIVKNHWSRREFVVLEFNGKEITVVASDIERAITNAQNAHRF